MHRESSVRAGRASSLLAREAAEDAARLRRRAGELRAQADASVRDIEALLADCRRELARLKALADTPLPSRVGMFGQRRVLLAPAPTTPDA